MINKSKSTLLLSVAALTFTLAAPAPAAEIRDIWKNTAGQAWKNSFGECWRGSYSSPAEATTECDPDLVPKPAPTPPAPPAKPVAPPPPALAPAPAAKPPAPPPPAPVTEKVSLAAD